ncbi:hypothetical protein JZ751_016620 [Albula glossodonta]|uniref:3-ketoacyl-[acyl-carrier-protein] reductase beta subunit n=1 Tax=Albula glossodonta TaxID=121402 RepID=A0A8T2MRU0_9TELE|nr:hypothetical protein JZ751_016620 [Albula glossodonta]
MVWVESHLTVPPHCGHGSAEHSYVETGSSSDVTMFLLYSDVGLGACICNHDDPQQGVLAGLQGDVAVTVKLYFYKMHATGGGVGSRCYDDRLKTYPKRTKSLLAEHIIMLPESRQTVPKRMPVDPDRPGALPAGEAACLPARTLTTICCGIQEQSIVRLACESRSTLVEGAVLVMSEVGVVFGGSRGIGRAVSQLLAARGHRVAVISRNLDAAEAAAARLAGGSVVGQKGNSGQCVYSSTKAGLEGFTRSLAKEVASRNIRVNLVAPGFVRTDMTAGLDEEALVRGVPLGRFGEPDEVAQAVLFLLEAPYVTGQVLPVDGGLRLAM